MGRLSGWGKNMNSSIKRRINITTCWASSRIALLDSVERYEDSYAINQEFCEWITDINNDHKKLEQSLMRFPHSFIKSHSLKNSDADELLEL